MQSVIIKAHSLLVDAMGTSGMDSALLSAVNLILPTEEVFGFERHPSAITDPFVPVDETRDIFVSAGAAKNILDRLSPKHLRFRVYDPLTSVLLSPLGPSTIATKLRASEIANANFRYQYFERLQYGERISLGIKSDQCWFVLNLYRHNCHATASASVVSLLYQFSQFAIPLLTKHHSLFESGLPRPIDAVDKIIKILSKRYPELSERELEVCARTIAGHSSKLIGAFLHVSPTTVLTYRQRAYRKLGISTASQLIGPILHETTIVPSKLLNDHSINNHKSELGGRTS